MNTIANMGFMGKLNFASYGLWFGTIGQAGLYDNLLPHLPPWAITVPLYLPFLTVFTISFCKVPPFGPKPFRNCLLFAMCWYVLMAVIAETAIIVIRPPAHGHFPIIAARAITYLGALSFLVLIPAYLSLRRVDSN